MNAADTVRVALRSPLAVPYLRFCLLPQGDPRDRPTLVADLPTLERHRADRQLQDADLAALVPWQEPALPLLLLPAARLQALVLQCGVLLTASEIRRCIRRHDREQLQDQLGAAACRFACLRAPTLHAGLKVVPGWELPSARECARGAGAALLCRALDGAPSGVRQRGRWQLPTPAPTLQQAVDEHLEPAAALGLARALLAELEPTWLSSFSANP